MPKLTENCQIILLRENFGKFASRKFHNSAKKFSERTKTPSKPRYTLNLKLMMSPSWTGYSLLSKRSRPFSLAPAKEPHSTKSL